MPLIWFPAIIILIPCLLYSSDSLISNTSLLSLPLMVIKKDSLKKEKLLLKNDEDDELTSLSVNSVYVNINEESTLKTIKKDLKEVAGIYAIVYNETKNL